MKIVILFSIQVSTIREHQFLDEFDSQYAYNLEETAGIKYTLSLFYPNNNYWGSAFGNYYFITLMMVP